MKRWLLRLSALSGVVVLGLFAIAQAQRSTAATDNLAVDPPATAPLTLPAEGASPRAARDIDPPNRFSADSTARIISIEDQPARRLRPDAPAPRGADGVADGALAPGDPFNLHDRAAPAAAPDRFPAAQVTAAYPADPAPAADGSRGAAPEGRGDGSSIYGNGGRAPRSDRSEVRPVAATAPAATFDDRDARPLAGHPDFEPARIPPADGAAPRALPAAEGRDIGADERSPAAGGGRGSPFGSDRSATSSVMKGDSDSNHALHSTADDSASATPAAVEGTGRPGVKQLEGPQSPHLTIEKTAPAEVQIGKPAKFEIKIRNDGNVAAEGIEIRDEVPKGTRLIATTPAASVGPRGQLSWSFNTLNPGEQLVAQLELMPIAEGEIGSVASVTFRAEASARALATRPQLALQVTAPKQVMIGSDARLVIRLSNPGTGAASGVVLSERVPAGLKHPAGSELEFDVGTLKPGESRQIELALNAVQAGHATNVLTAHGDGNLKAQERADIQVIAPALAVAMTGPSRRYLERQATYTVSVSNPGTAPAKDVQLVTQLPKGMKFVKANNSGQFDPNTNTVTWSLEELPATETGSVSLVAVPVEIGEQRLTVQGKARQGLSAEKEQTVVVEGLASLAFEVQGADEAIEIGGETTYQIHVVNQGSKGASNVRITAIFPPELKALRAEGPTRESVEDHRVGFEPIARLAPKAEATFRIRAQALKAGDLRVKVQITSDDARQPILKEESTRVYTDH